LTFMGTERLLDPQDFELIRELSLVTKKRVTGLLIGEQRSPIQSGGIEFADYRQYQVGDDLRRIDWLVFLRLRQLLIKLCAEEKEFTLMLILDLSKSMQYGEFEKLWSAKKIAAILGGIALHDGNRAGVLGLGNGLRELAPPTRGRSSLTEMINKLAKANPSQRFHPVEGVRHFAARYGRKCMFVFLSDLLYPEWEQVIRGLGASGCEGFVLQILAREELNPPYMGEITLDDLEGWGEVPLHVSKEIARYYMAEFSAFLNETRRTCLRRGLGHALLSSDLSLAHSFHTYLKQEGLIC